MNLYITLIHDICYFITISQVKKRRIELCINRDSSVLYYSSSHSSTLIYMCIDWLGGGMVDYKNRSSYLGLYWMVLVQVVILTSWAAVHHR